MPQEAVVMFVLGTMAIAFWKGGPTAYVIACIVAMVFAVQWWGSYSWQAGFSLLLISLWAGYKAIMEFIDRHD